MTSVLITGGSGFLGRALASRFLADGLRTCLYARGEHAMAAAAAELGHPELLRCFIGDVRDSDRLFRALHGVDYVVHAAALKRVEVGEYNPTEMVRTNVEGSVNLLNACHAKGVKRAVLVSTDKAVGPVNAYGASKMLAERLFLGAAGPCEHTVVRYGNVAGSTGSVIERWRDDPWTATATDLDATRYWMSVDEAVGLVCLALFGSYKRIVLPSGLRAYRLADLAEAMRVIPKVTGMRDHEKMHETLDGITTSADAPRMSVAMLEELTR